MCASFSPFARGTQSASLQWSPNPDTNVIGYALYIGTKSGNYTSRIDVGTNTTSTLSGLSNGMTFYFVATAYDTSDVESAPSNEANFASPTNNPPSLHSVSNYNVAAMNSLIITNSATDSVKNARMMFTLDAGAPTNMLINTNTGMMQWLIPLSCAGTTNPVTVRVTDNGVPPQSAIQTFTVTVSNYVQINFGASIVPLGQTSSVPLILNCSTGVTNVSFTLDVPPNRMTNLSVTSLVPSLATVTQSGSGAAHSVVTVKALPGQVLQGPLTFGRLNYKAVTGLPSCFAPLHGTNVSAIQSNGVPVVTGISGIGSAVLIGSQPLTQSAITTNHTRNVTIYGLAGTNYQLQSKSGLTGTWTNESSRVTMPTNLFSVISNVPLATTMKFYRTQAQ